MFKCLETKDSLLEEVDGKEALSEYIIVSTSATTRVQQVVHLQSILCNPLDCSSRAKFLKRFAVENLFWVSTVSF